MLQWMDVGRVCLERELRKVRQGCIFPSAVRQMFCFAVCVSMWETFACGSLPFLHRKVQFEKHRGKIVFSSKTLWISV